MIITKWKQIINGIFPFKDNHKINNDLKKKMNTIEIDELLFTAGNERARKKHDVRISLLILHRVVSFLQL